MNKFKVLGEEGVEVDILGTMHKAGDVVELSETDAKPLVDEGKLEAVTEESDTKKEEEKGE